MFEHEYEFGMACSERLLLIETARNEQSEVPRSPIRARVAAMEILVFTVKWGMTVAACMTSTC